MFIAFPLVSTLVYGVKTLSRLISNTNPFAYYYLKPTMVDFWKSASILSTSFVVEGGISHPIFANDNTVADRIGVPVSLDTSDMEEFKKLMPRMFIVLWRVLTNTQMLMLKLITSVRIMRKEKNVGGMRRN